MMLDLRLDELDDVRRDGRPRCPRPARQGLVDGHEIRRRDGRRELLSASSLARFRRIPGGIRRLGGRLPDDGVKGLASPSAGAGAGAAAAEAMAAAVKWLPLSTIRSRQRERRLL